MSRPKQRGISPTEIRIHASAADGRLIIRDIHDRCKKRGWEYEPHRTHQDYGTLFRSDGNFLNENINWELPGCGKLRGHSFEVKICNTSGGDHKNCVTPFKVALGAGMSHFIRGYWPFFLFVDLVDIGDHQAGHRHQNLVDELQNFGIPTRVMTRMPTQPDYDDIVNNWFLSNPLLLPGVIEPMVNPAIYRQTSQNQILQVSALADNIAKTINKSKRTTP